MAFDVTLTGEITPDHKLSVELPSDLPPGRVSVRVNYLEEEAPKDAAKIRTAEDLLNSEFFGSAADRDDLPKTDEEFRAWRQRIGKGDPY